jgi:hypothetical protein
MYRSQSLTPFEERGDGSVFLAATGGTPWGTAAAGVGAGVVVLAAVASGEVPFLGAALVAAPLGVILVLAGLAAARHRDWVLFDRRAGQVVFRRGLAAMFRPVRTLPFDDVEAVRVEEADGVHGVALVLTGDVVWPVHATADPAEARRLAAALRAVGGWPARGGQEAVRP